MFAKCKSTFGRYAVFGPFTEVKADIKNSVSEQK